MMVQYWLLRGGGGVRGFSDGTVLAVKGVQ